MNTNFALTRTGCELKGNGKLGGGLMLVAPVIAAMLAPQSLIGSFLLILGGGLAFLVKPKIASAAAS